MHYLVYSPKRAGKETHFISLTFVLPSPEDMVVDFREKREEREREVCMGERNVDLLHPARTLLADRICNLHMCPDWDRTGNLLLYRKTLQTPEQPGWGCYANF